MSAPNMTLSEIKRWAQEEMGAAVKAKAAELLDPDNSESMDFDEREAINKQRDRVLRFLNLPLAE